MIDTIKSIFRSRDRKKIMLVGLLLSSIVIYSGLSFLAIVMNFYHIFLIKLSLVLIITILLILYLHHQNTKLFASILLILIDIESSFSIISRDLYEFITVYPFLIIFGFYFFFKLKTALLLTVIHIVYWIIAIIIKHRELTEHPLFSVFVPDFNMFTSSIVVIALAYLYNISTEISYEELEKDDKVKELLLKEIHHRIKNNLNVVASILGLQMRNVKKETSHNTYEILKTNKLRIESIAMIHEALYKDYNTEKVDFKNYTLALTELINKTYNKNIEVNIDTKNIYLPIKSMFQFGIILNELFTNSIKYGFINNGQEEQVKIKLTKKENKFLFSYQENISNPINLEELYNNKSLGMKLIQLTVKEMNGELTILRNSGLIFNIKFEDIE